MFKKKEIACLSFSLMFGGSFLITSCNDSSIKSVDKLALARKIEYCENNYLSDEFKSKYTEDSYNDFLLSLSNAKKVNDSSEATQSEVDEALKNLNTAIDNLKAKYISNLKFKDITSYVDKMNGNYTLTFKDYYSDKTDPKTYIYESIDGAYYNKTTNKGSFLFDEFSRDFEVKENKLNIIKTTFANEWSKPSYVLSSEYYGRYVSAFGKSEPFTSYGLETYGYAKLIDNSDYYQLDNINYVYFLMETIDDIYKCDFDNPSVYGEYAFITLKDNNLKALITKDKEMKDIVFEFDFSNVGATSIKEVSDYIDNNKSYVTNEGFDFNATLEDILNKNKINNYGLKLKVSKKGMSFDDSYSIINVNNADKKYWYESNTNKAIFLTGTDTKVALIHDEDIEISGDSSFSIDDINIIEKLFSKKDKFKLNYKYEEYLLDCSNDPSLQEFLFNYFNLGKETKLRKEDIINVSLKNIDNKLMINLWQGGNESRDALILSSIVEEYQDVKYDLLENIDKLSKEELTKIYNLYKDIENNNQYSEYSFKLFKTVLNKAKSLIDDMNSNVNDMNEVNTLLKLRYKELESVSKTFDNDGENKIKKLLNGTKKYRVSYNIDNTNSSYIASDKYFYDENNNNGYLILENVVYNFNITDNKVNLIKPVYNKANTMAINYLSRLDVLSYLPSFNGLLELEDYEDPKASGNLVRISNSNEYFVNKTKIMKIIPNFNLDDIKGVSLEVNNNSLKIKGYKLSNMKNIKVDGGSSLDNASILRTDVVASATITDFNNVKNDIIDAYLNGEEKINKKEDILKITKDIGLNKCYIRDYNGNEILISNKYYYNSETFEMYLLVNNQVLTLGANGFEPYQIDGKNVTSIKEITDKKYGDLSLISSLKDTDLTDYRNKDDDESSLSRVNYNVVNSSVYDVLFNILGLDKEDYLDEGTYYLPMIKLGLSNNEVSIAQYNNFALQNKICYISSNIEASPLHQNILDMIASLEGNAN